ncbi:MAG: tyrosine-type recombinase/integrase [Eubacteriales bacterium]|nr:tyrosine-type recombinase/integrase [Eubacteriales bacterium]
MFDLKGFELSLYRQEFSENTVSCYIRDTKEFLKWLDGQGKHITEIDEFILINYKKHLLKLNQSILSKNRKLASLNSFCKFLCTDNVLDEIISIKLVRNRERGEYKGLQANDLHRLRELIHQEGNKQHICIIELLISTGIRVSELCNLRLQDITLDGDKSKIHVVGKGSVNRAIPLNTDAKKAIEDYLEVRPNTDQDNLIIGQRGSYSRNAINLILEKYGKSLGFKVTPHNLRHSFAYKLIMGGAPITMIQDLLGHSSILTTIRYTQVTEQDKVDALNGLDW